MNAVVETVRSLWVPLNDLGLLVPNVAIAEVINYQPLDMVQDGPEWLLGVMRWRDQELPVVSMERLLGFESGAGTFGYVVFQAAIPLGLGAILGAFTGVKLAVKSSAKLLRNVFAALLIVAIARIIFKIEF